MAALSVMGGSALVDQMQLEAAQVFIGGGARRSAQKLGELANRSDVGLSRFGCKFAHSQVLLHALTQWGDGLFGRLRGCAPVVNEANCLNSQQGHTHHFRQLRP